MSTENFALSDFEKAGENLKEVLALEKNEINRDSAIKRFELCFDLAWKCIKIEAKKQGLECYSPKECFKTAFQLKIVDHNEKWLEMLKDRNQVVHIYKEEYADEVYARMPEYLKLFKDLIENLKKIKN